MDFYLLENSNNYRVEKLRDETGQLVTGAALTLEVRKKNSDGTSTQIQAPLNFVDEGKGDYRVHLPSTLPLEEDTQYQAIIEGTADGRVFAETRSLYAKRRLTV